MAGGQVGARAGLGVARVAGRGRAPGRRPFGLGRASLQYSGGAYSALQEAAGQEFNLARSQLRSGRLFVVAGVALVVVVVGRRRCQWRARRHLSLFMLKWVGRGPVSPVSSGAGGPSLLSPASGSSSRHTNKQTNKRRARCVRARSQWADKKWPNSSIISARRRAANLWRAMSQRRPVARKLILLADARHRSFILLSLRPITFIVVCRCIVLAPC